MQCPFLQHGMNKVYIARSLNHLPSLVMDSYGMLLASPG